MIRPSMSYESKPVYMGIDVHRKSYTLTCRCDSMLVKRCHMPADPTAVVEFCSKRFPGARLFSAYEAGFSGFRLHCILCAHNIQNIVVHPAAIEVAARDRIKTNKRDSAKIAEQLAAGRLHGITVPTEEKELKRLLTRGREQLLRQRTRLQNQLRMRLHQFGLLEPADPRRMYKELVTAVLQHPLPPELRLTVETLYALWQGIDEQLRQIATKLRESQARSFRTLVPLRARGWPFGSAGTGQ